MEKKILSTKKQLDFMIKLASNKHFGQTDKSGLPYILHPLRLMQQAQILYPNDLELAMIAVAHDLMEDTDVTADFLRENGVSERVISALLLLTHGKESYKEYILLISTNPDAVIVKILDLDDNSKLSRLKGLTAKDFARAAKYHTCHAFLTGKITKEEFEASENV